jgi:hypothetical protein
MRYFVAEEVLDQLKLRVAGEHYEEIEEDVYFEDDTKLSEANVQKMGRTRLVRVRVRGGKIQRRKKFATVKGYTIRHGRVVRMSALEIRHRKMAARRAKFKRRAKLKQSLRKRKISLRRRRSMGL